MPSSRLPACSAVALALLLAAGPAGAQPAAAPDDTHSATLAGLVVDETNGVVPDVAIAAMNTATGVRRRTASGGDGRFAMPLLPAGSYIVTAERQGFAPLEVQDVVLAPDSCLLLRIQLQVGRLQESVRVTAPVLAEDAPTGVLLSAASRGSHEIDVAGELQRSLPLSSSRAFSDVLLLTSGVMTGGAGPSIHGAGPNSTIVLFDGMDVTSNRQAGTALVLSGAEMIERVDLKTAGMDASVPLTQGGVINITTRSGGDAYHGEAGAVVAPRAWTSNNEPGGTSTRASLFEPVVTLGGPILRGRLSFFGSARQATADLPASRSPMTIYWLKALVPGWTDEALPEGRRDLFGKLDARLSPSQVLSAFYQYGSYFATGPGGIAAGPFTRAIAGGSAAGVRWAATWSDRLTSRLSVSYNDKTASLESDFLDATPVAVHERTFGAGATLYGTGAIAYLNAMPGGVVSQPARKLSITGDATWYRQSRLGTHELNVGLDLQPMLRERAIARYANNRVSVEEVVFRVPGNPAAGTIPFHRLVIDASSVTKEDMAGSSYGLYVQDRWRPLSWITFNAGLRFDWLHDTDRVTRGVVRDTLAAGPRASFSVELTPRTVLHAGWGRVHESAQFNRYSEGVVPRVGQHNLYDVDLDGSFETDFYLPGSSANPLSPGWNASRVDVYRGQPHVDELAAGIRRQIPGGIALQVGIVRRVFRDIPAAVNDALIYENNEFVGFRPELLPSHTVVTANRWYRPVVTDLTVQAIRQAGRLQLVAGYARNWRHLSGTWVDGDPASILQPGAFANDKGIGSTELTTTDSLTSGRADTAGIWIDHTFRLAAAWQSPWGTGLAGSYQLQSGPWSGPIVNRIPSSDPQYGPADHHAARPHRSIIRLATTMRFRFSDQRRRPIPAPLAAGPEPAAQSPDRNAMGQTGAGDRRLQCGESRDVHDLSFRREPGLQPVLPAGRDAPAPAVDTGFDTVRLLIRAAPSKIWRTAASYSMNGPMADSYTEGE